MGVHSIPHEAALPEQRRQRIAEALESARAVRALDLAVRFGVSVETIRRDLLTLEGRGLASRVHGGAVLPVPRAFERTYEERRIENLHRKQVIARAAAALIKPGDTLVLDVGTSVAELAKVLPEDLEAKVLTCSLLVAQELAGRAGLEVVSSGGRVRGGDLACSGPTTQAFFTDYYTDRVFLGSGGVDPSAGLTDYHLEEIAVRRIIIGRARERYVLADSTKIGHVAVGKVCPLDALTGVITDSDADPEVLAAIEEQGVTVIVAEIDNSTRHPAVVRRKREP